MALKDNMKKEYTRPEISNIKIDKEISLILMTYSGDNPPGPPHGHPGSSGAAAANPFEENSFNKPLK